jgi:catechol 2,3-dioxygenase-like lactoylglutathione lyase family enzyme
MLDARRQLTRFSVAISPPAMIDHIGVHVSDFQRSVDFYSKALAPLGFKLVKSFEGKYAGFGAGKPDFWIEAGRSPTDRVHVAFCAKGREAVRAFYEAALAAGGTDNGAPGVRAHYHADYYGAFVIDPDGHNIEAVCHDSYL